MIPHPSADVALPQLALIVDGHEDTRELYRAFLVPRRYVVDAAEDGLQALAKVSLDVPDIIVMETQLAGIDGYELCALLRAERSTAGVPIVILTAETRSNHLEQARQAGADAVLTKPCLPEVLFTRMEQVREQSRAVRARSSIAREVAAAGAATSADLMTRSAALTKSKRHERYATTTPPLAPLAARCPQCDAMLKFLKSLVGGVSENDPEQWDTFACTTGCGLFQYRHRTRRLRLMGS